MAWFGWKSGRAVARPALGRAGGVPRAIGEWPQGYEAQVRAGYCGNAIAQRAVKLVAEAVEGAPLDVSDARLRALVAGRGFLEAVSAQVLLHGNAFVQVLRDGDGQVAELFALRPERVSVELGADGWPGAYLYRVGVRTTRLDPGSVIHVRRFNPVDDHYGLGCLGAASAAIAIHNAAAAWSKALLDNAARPSGALVYDAGDGSVLSPDQFRRLREEMEQGFAGAANAGRPMLLEGGLKWQAMSLTPADMDFAGTKAAAAREIALGFGVPPMLLGLPGDSTHANYKEANKALWRLTVLPLAGAILSAIRDGLAEAFPAARLQIDLDRVPALVEDRERLWRMVAAADFITRDEKRQMVDWA
ncbi:HK97 family phage portal protein [Sphingomonas sp. BE138]|uniref:phage portal protein n=1 Tax=Sphingomonas sp. BE138 TaxID=2817845 RepID=UPI00285A2413|nr:phage portal protein [Sphingomonas sp. BE138]MDR6788912.1 HK97 family phage portal protein [Sphingomonas sp. BE138]